MPSQGDILRFDTIGDFDDVDEIVGVYHVMYIDPGDTSNETALGDFKALIADLWALITGIHNVLVTIRRIRGYNHTTSELMGESAFGTPLVGTSTGEVGITQATVPITFKTSTPKVMLRKLWGPPAEGNIDADGRYGSGVTDALALAAAFMMDDLVAGGRSYVYGYPSPIALDFVTPTVAVYSNIPGTLRRRRIGVGS